MIIKRDKEDILKEFKEEYLESHWVRDFIEIDEVYRNKKSEIDKELMETFERLCDKCISLQNSNLKGNIKYIYFSFLRTSFCEGRGEFRIDAYDENWFLDKSECYINMNFDFVYKSLFEFMDELKKERKKYGSDLNDMDIEEIILDEADKYLMLVIEFLKDRINQFIQAKSYSEMKKCEDIKIIAGEYMGHQYKTIF